MTRLAGLLAAVLAFGVPILARSVAITIDDLPRGGDHLPRDLRTVRGMTGRFSLRFRRRKFR